MRNIWKLTNGTGIKAAAAAVLLICLAAPAHAVTIATFDPGAFLQSGVITNNYTSNIVGIEIDLGIDSGSAGGTPVWDALQGIGTGSDASPTFSDAVAGSTRYFFTVSFNGIDVTTGGGTFQYTFLDIDAWFNPDFGAGNPVADGTEIVTLLFANGSTVSAVVPAGSGNPISQITFELEDLQPVPLPAALPLFLTGLAGLGLVRRRRKIVTITQ